MPHGKSMLKKEQIHVFKNKNNNYILQYKCRQNNYMYDSSQASYEHVKVRLSTSKEGEALRSQANL